MAGNGLKTGQDGADNRWDTSAGTIKRDVLYFKAPGSEDVFLEGLAELGWLPCAVEEPLEAEALARSRAIYVGVVLCSESQRKRIEDIMAGSSLNWVALVPEQLAPDADCWPLIDSCCFDYHRFPIDLQRLSTILGHAYGMAQLRRHLARQRCSSSPEELMVGRSAAMRGLSQKLSKIAKADAPVLITGETGTGKELAARLIHEGSERAKGPFETVNCAALPPNLIQTELFGHEKGSFTGAYNRRIGRFEAADGGTIFLDEIGDLPIELQATLLRILEERKLRRVGGSEDVALDVRVLAATHVDLKHAVKDGHFREDLYFRLNVLKVHLPALRERENDVDFLADHFLQEAAKRQNIEGLRFTQEARVAIRNYEWPGNVRELINYVERGVVMAEHNLVTAADMGMAARKLPRARETLEAARARVEKKALISALYRTDHNIAQVARELGVSRVTVYRLIEKYNIGHYTSESSPQTDEA